MGMNMSFMGMGLKGASVSRILSLVTDTMYEQFVQKDIKHFEGFLAAIVDTFSTVNMALPGKHYDPPPLKDIEDFFNKWEKEDSAENRKKIFTDFLQKNVHINKADESVIVTAIVAPPAAMVAKRTGQTLPQLKLMKAVPDVMFVPSATVVALVAVKVLRLMFMKKITPKDGKKPREEQHSGPGNIPSAPSDQLQAPAPEPVEAPAPAPTPTRAQAPELAEALAPAPAPAQALAPEPEPVEAPAPVSAPAPAPTPTRAQAPKLVEAPAPAPAFASTQAPAPEPEPVEAPAPVSAPTPASAPTPTRAQAPELAEAPAPAPTPAPAQAPAPEPEPVEAPAPVSAPAPAEAAPVPAEAARKEPSGEISLPISDTPDEDKPQNLQKWILPRL